MSFILWTGEEDGIELGPTLEVFQAFREYAKLEPDGYGSLYGVAMTDQEVVSREYLERVRAEAREFLAEHANHLSDQARNVLATLVAAEVEEGRVRSAEMGMGDGGNGAVLSPTRTLRSYIDATAADDSPPSRRARELVALREELIELQGAVDDALVLVEAEDDGRPMYVRRDLIELRENADLREELIERGFASADELDELGWVSHVTIDRAIELGVLEEAIGRFLPRLATGPSAGLTGAARRTFERLHPRSRRGEWVEKPGGAPQVPEARSRVGRPGRGPILRERPRELAPQRRGAAGGGPRFTRHRPIANHPDIGKEIRGSIVKKVLLNERGGEEYVFETTPATADEIVRATEAGIDHPSLSYRARSQLRERGQGAKRNAPGERITRAQAKAQGYSEEEVAGQTFEDVREKGYQQRLERLRDRVAQAIRGGTEAEDVVAPGDFNDAERTSQARLLRYAREAASTPTTAEQHAQLDNEGNYVTDDNGNVVYDTDRAQLHEEIAEVFLRRRRLDEDGKPQLCPECDDMEGSDDPQVLFSGGGYASGKGGVVDRIIEEMDAENTLVLDPDEIKALLPEFAATLEGDPEANLRVFEQAWSIAQVIQRKAQERKLNIVVDGISNGHADEMLARVDSFRAAGYESPRVIYVDIPTEEALSRAADRAKKAKKPSDRRHIPEPIMRAVHRDVAATIPGVINGAAERNMTVEVWDNHQGKDPETGKWNPPKRFAHYDPQAANPDDFVEDRALWTRLGHKSEEVIPGVEGELPPLSERTQALVDQARRLGIDKYPPDKDEKALAVLPSGVADTREKHAHKLPNGHWRFSEERQKEHERIIAELFDDHKPQPPGERRILHLYGGSATGKGTVKGLLKNADQAPKDAVDLDPDPIKDMLPEASLLEGSPYKANALHQESRHIMRLALERSMEQGINVIVDTVGGSGDPGARLAEVEAEREAGYTPEAVIVDAPLDSAIERAMIRAFEEGRFVPLEVIKENHASSSARLQELIDLDWLPLRVMANRKREMDLEEMQAARRGEGGDFEIFNDADFDAWRVKADALRPEDR